MSDILEKRIRVFGIVQGVGFRPTVDRLAHEAGITGTVANKGAFVEIFAEGTSEEIDTFLEFLKTRAPERSDVLKIEVEDADLVDEIKENHSKIEEYSKRQVATLSENISTKKCTETNSTNSLRKYDDFKIIESEKVKADIFISPDIAICDKCKAELFDRTNRRYLHPFINCNECGPRFSILKALPYDRERTSMSVFPMCEACASEYYSPASRRYDAQPVCCNECGPEVYIIETDSTAEFAQLDAAETISTTGFSKAAGNENKSENCSSDNRADCSPNQNADCAPGNAEIDQYKIRDGAAITFARKILCSGGIVAIKGIGGFHLACNATNEDAVNRLRTLKHRPMKPFAVMAKNEAIAGRECMISAHQRKEMNGHRKPIILMEKKEDGRIAEAVAPENPYVGLMLPYAPVQMLIFDYPDAWQDKMPDVLVMTSGNISGAPIASNDEEAVTELSNMCDAILSNNREIQIRTDDSVMDYYDGEPYMIRRSRGIAPLPVILDLKFLGKVLGIGGELKNTFCLGIHNMFYPSAYVGDLADIRTVSALKSAIVKTEKLLEMKPEIIACDLHPKYNSTLVAEELSKEKEIPLVRVQHHYAHVLSCMAENDYFDDVIGVSFDGTGFGTDGTIWGGEFLLSNLSGFTREASIMPFLQIGGDASSKEGWRIATSMIFSLFGDGGMVIAARLGLSDEKMLKVQKTMFDKKINCILSTSAGRLFDSVSAILGIRNRSTFEGEASTALMYKAMEFEDKESAALMQKKVENQKGIDDSTVFRLMAMESDSECEDSSHEIDSCPGCDIIRTDILVKKIVEERLNGRDASELAYFFHRALSDMIVDGVIRISEKSGVKTAALTGGVFQNKLLLQMTEDGLTKRSIKVLRHHMIPPNDGGIALGQAVFAAARLNT